MDFVNHINLFAIIYSLSSNINRRFSAAQSLIRISSILHDGICVVSYNIFFPNTFCFYFMFAIFAYPASVL